MRVLFFVHGHPEFIRGGAEQVALELFEAFRERDDTDPVLVARTGDPAFIHPGTLLGVVDGSDDQILLFSEHVGPDDYFFGTAAGKELYTRHIAALLEDLRPDVVHFQHSELIGFEAIRAVRKVLPKVPILYTLHEYRPICNAGGQMVRTKDYELCTHASPQRCHQCFPEHSPGRFYVRERYIKAQLELVDRFIAPSRFLLERYVSWGLPREKIIELDHGRHPLEPAPARHLGPGEKRSSFGFFGQLNPYKGVDVLVEAMALLERQGRDDIRLYLSGANLDLQPKAIRKRLKKLLRKSPDTVSFLGSYHPSQLKGRMGQVDWVVIPSIWWENSPLVVQEAFMHGRPVVTSNIGGMAEKVDDGVNGLHFAVGEPQDLARVLVEAADTEGLWERLRAGIPAVTSSAAAAERHAEIYRELSAPPTPASAVTTGMTS